jgi:hypothetical protein
MFLKKVFNSVSLNFFASIFKYLSFSKIVGANFLALAPGAILFPSALIFSSFGWLSLTISSLIRWLFFGYASALLGFLSPVGAYLYYKFRLARFLLPLFCIVLFVLHPTGFAAFNYALLWLIPLSLAFYQNSIFLSIGASFAAHAVGSVVWIYLFPALPSAAWSGLIYLVLVERSLIAAGIYCLGYYNSYNRYIGNYAQNLAKKLAYKFNLLKI